MDPTPLLAHSNTGGLYRSYALASSVRSSIWTYSLLIYSSGRKWWAVTANPDYLGSWASRRTLWSLFFPFMLFARVVSSFWLHGFWWEISDFAAIGFAILMWRIPVRNIWHDLIPVAWIMCDLRFVFYNPVAWTWTLLLLFFVGLHSYAICLLAGGCLIAICFYTPDQLLMNAIPCVLTLTLLFVAEFRTASVYFDLQQKSQSLEMLLDKATDGSCSVEATKGIIRNASPKLEKTLGTSGNLVGRRLYDFVQNSDHSALHTILGSPSGVQQMNAALVTCIQGPCECGASGQVTFDAKVIPFTTSAGILRICLQVQGEVRNVQNQTDESRSFESSSAASQKGNWLDSDKKRSNEYESLSPAKKSVSEVSDLDSWCAEKKPASEVSFAYTVTESICSGNQRSTQFLVSSKSTISPGSQVRHRDAGVQTDQPALICPGRDCLETNSCSWTQQHLNQPANPMDLTAVCGKGTNRPPLLPNVSAHAVSQVSRGRSPGAKRLWSPPRAQARELQSRAQLLHTEENDELRADAKSMAAPTKATLLLPTAQSKQTVESNNVLPDAKSMARRTQAIPAFPATKPRQAPRCRKRLGHDMSQWSLCPSTSMT